MDPGTLSLPPTQLGDAGSPAAAAAPPEVEIVCGPSCVGKSVYIQRFADRFDDVFFVHKPAEGGLRPGGRYALHYNLLHPYDQPRFRPSRPRTYAKCAAYLARRAIWRKNRFEGEFALRRLLEQPATYRATILIAPRALLASRVGSRDQLEPLTPDGKSKRYRQERWQDIYRHVDLAAVLRQWLGFLRRRNIAYALVDASTPEYKPIPSDEAAIALMAGAGRGDDPISGRSE